MAAIPLERWVTKHVRRIRIGQFLHRAADFGAGFLFFFGGVVLVTKLLIPQLWPHVLWLAAGVLPVWGVAWWLVLRRPWDHRESVARLDNTLETGGLLMTLSERPDAEWQDRLPQVEVMWQRALPRIRPKRFAGYLALPLAFAVAACFVPLRDANSSFFTPSTLAGKEAKKLEELLDKLDETPALEPEEQKQIKEEISKLAEEAKEKPFNHEKWEAIDALRERLRERVDSANSLNEQVQDALQSLSQEMDGTPLKLSPEEAEQLQKMLEKMQTSGDLDKAMKDAPKDVREALEKLLKSQKDGQKNGEGSAEDQAALETLMKHLQKTPSDNPETRQALQKLSQSMQASASKRAQQQERQDTLRKNLSQSLQKLEKKGAFSKAPKDLQEKLKRLTKRKEGLDMPKDPKERQKMMEELREFLDKESTQLEELAQECSNCDGDCDKEGNCKDGKCKNGKCRGNRPGKGGVSRGRGDAPLTWGDEATKNGVRFKEVELPEGELTDPKDDVLRVTRTAPTDKPAAAAARGEQRNHDPAAGSVTVNHKLSPKHRGAVRRYFESTAPSRTQSK